MLKIIGTIALILVSTNVFSQEYLVVISDELTGDVVVEKCTNEVELKSAVEFAQNLNDDSIKYSIKKIFSLGTMAVKRGGGEGSGD